MYFARFGILNNRLISILVDWLSNKVCSIWVYSVLFDPVHIYPLVN
nr:hypothetical protein CJLB15_00109 [Campylobacter phage CJLB-15]